MSGNRVDGGTIDNSTIRWSGGYLGLGTSGAPELVGYGNLTVKSNNGSLLGLGSTASLYSPGVIQLEGGSLRMYGGTTFYSSVTHGSITYFNGSIDEVRIYNKTLNITEVENIYSAKRAYTNQTISSDGLILWLPINEKSGTDVFDATGNLGNGDLTGSDYEWTNGDLTEIKWIWDNSNYTIYNDNNLILMLNLDNRSSLGGR